MSNGMNACVQCVREVDKSSHTVFASGHSKSGFAHTLVASGSDPKAVDARLSWEIRPTRWLTWLFVSLLWISAGLFAGAAIAAELQYQYFFGNQAYPTLSAAEAAMRAASEKNRTLKQYRHSFNSSTGQITFNYNVPDIPARQVGPTVYWAAAACASAPFCYSEEEAYDAYIKRSGSCNVQITSQGSYGAESFAIGGDLSQGREWPDGVAWMYLRSKHTFRADWGVPDTQGGCPLTYHQDGLSAERWRPWGCPKPYSTTTVNTTYDTCRITAQATITAKPVQFCGPETANPIRVLTGEKVLRHDDIALSDVRLSRFYHSSGQSVITKRLAPGWQHSYSQYLMLDGSASVPLYAVREDGNFVRLKYTASRYVSNGEPRLQVTRIAEVFELTLPDGTVETYGKDYANKVGNLLAIRKPSGSAVTIQYDGSQRIRYVRSVFGQFLEFGYANNRLETITDNMGRVWEYGYDTLGNLTSVEYPDYTQIHYHYEDAAFPNYVTGVTDPRGIRYSTFAYDARGRAETSYLASGVERVDVTYGLDGVQTVTNSRGAKSSYSGFESLGMKLVSNVTGPGCAGCGASNTNYTYDTSNNLTTKTVNGVQTRYYNYSKGQVGYKIEAYGTTNARRITYQYDPRFYNIVTKIIEPSVINTSPSSACNESTNCKVTTYTYDDWGNRLTETVSGFKPGGTRVSRSTTYQYNGPLRQLTQMDGPRTDVSDITTYEYYPDDPVEGSNRARLQRVIDANGVVSRDSIQYSATGKVLSETRPNGVIRDYAYYSGNDRLETLTESDGAITRVVRWTYLPTGEVESLTQGYGSPGESTLTFGYDDARRLTRIIDGLGNYISYQLDTEGNREYERFYDNAGALKKQLYQTFDLYDRLDLTTQANETRNSDYAANGTLEKETDGRNSVTAYTYDALKRLTQVIQNQGGSDPTTANATSTYGYDVGDRLTSVTDPVNGKTAYVYDDLGNLVKQTSPDAGITTLGYDGAGNLLTKADAKGQTFSYSYDALNRITLSDGPGTDGDIAYSYDSCVNGTGRLCSVTRASEAVTYSYDAFGNVTAHQGVAYGYDAAGRVNGITYPDGVQVVYRRDAAGQITRVELQHGMRETTLFSGATYHPFGVLRSGQFGNGQSIAISVDQAYRQADRVSGPYQQLIDPSTGYDANGNLLAFSGSETPIFSYDSLNRLATADAASFGARDYDYDKNGNRTQLIADGSVTTYGYLPNSNRLNSIGWLAVAIDPNGNTSGQGAWTFTYDVHNRLATAMNGSMFQATYIYNGFGQRVQKAIETGDATRYVYGLNGELLAETSAVGAVNRAYIYLDSTPLAMLDGADLYYIHTDHLGTPKALTNTAGVKVWSATHDPFGKAAVDEDADGNGQVVTFNLRFPGQYFDKETGLHYNYFRDYDPATGRYVQSDPIGLAGGSFSTYAYVGNDPLSQIDPLGLANGPAIGWMNPRPSPSKQTSPSSASFRVHGNWCGPGWTGGRWHPYSDAPRGYYEPPTTYTDAACERHDKCFAMCREAFKCDKSARKTCMVQCNSDLAGAQRFDTSSGTSIFRSTAIWTGMQLPPNVEEDDPSCNQCKGSK